MREENLYFDEDTQRYYASRRDAERIKLFVKLKEGLLYPIQGFGRYTITSEGEVLNIRRAKPVKPFLNGHRLAIALINDQGRQTTVSLARLVALHFIPVPDEDQYYDACYKDGDILNVHPGNLYWEPRWKRHANPDNYEVDIT